MNRQLAARGLAVVAVLIASFEGVSLVAYRDPVGIPTACFGETENVRMGQSYTLDECNEKLGRRVIEFDDAVVRCVGYAPAVGPRAAFVSLAYNIGTQAFCDSTLARYARAGDMERACAEISRWVYAGGTQLPGLVKRRAKERALCETALHARPST